MTRILPLCLCVMVVAGCDSSPKARPPALTNAGPTVTVSLPPATENAAAPLNATAIEPPAQTVVAKPPAPAPGAVDGERPYRALGTEPFWAVTVDGNMLVLETPDTAARRYPISVSSQDGVIRYAGDVIQMTVTRGDCSDGMSDFTYADRVQVALAGTVLKGCGGARSGGEGDE